MLTTMSAIDLLKLGPNKKVAFVSAMTMGLCCTIPLVITFDSSTGPSVRWFDFLILAHAFISSAVLGWFWHPNIFPAKITFAWFAMNALLRGVMLPLLAIVLGAAIFLVTLSILKQESWFHPYFLIVALGFGWGVFLPLILPFSVLGSFLIQYVAIRGIGRC